ncbi:MAG TPA: acyl carrier protein [Methylocystis sp.]|nr:acyl carrier protein [Methylocystis sp.]
MLADSSNAEIRERIKALFEQIWREDRRGDPPLLTDQTVLLKTGIDSMSYAVLLARLEDELGLDPFLNAEEIRYPQTFGELAEFYASAKSAAA